MLHRDYLMRMIQLFFEALAKFIRNKEGKDPEILRPELDELYKMFLKHPGEFYKDLSIEEIINSFEEDTHLIQVEIVAELFYQDGLLGEVNRELLKKSLALYEYVDFNSETFSFDRQRKTMQLKEILKS